MARVFQGAVALACMAEANSSPPNYEILWNDFKKTYGKNYNDIEQLRFDTFKRNVDFIYEMNARNLAFTLGVNEFADLKNEEFSNMYLGYEKLANHSAVHAGVHTYSGEELPESVDWVAKGAVTKVKNQGQCGSCWSFSTTGSLEGAWQIATTKLVPLSEQEFVDCDKVDDGCQGGLMDNAFKFAEQNAVCTESSYAYTARGGSCQKSSCTVGIPQGGVVGFKDVKSDDVQAMMSAVAQQPVSIAIEADGQVFQLYGGGVLSGWCGGNLDHGVLCVGYGSDNGKKYWKVKNSWGASWGEKGYVRLLRAKGTYGECGILKEPSYPVVKDTSSVTKASVAAADPPLAYGKVCINNDAAFVMHWKLRDLNQGTSGKDSPDYPINQQKCKDITELDGVEDGDLISATVHAEMGISHEVDKPVKYGKGSQYTATYTCTGATLTYGCHLTGAQEVVV